MHSRRILGVGCRCSNIISDTEVLETSAIVNEGQNVGPGLGNFRLSPDLQDQLEDTEGFEPSKPRKELVSLARRWFQPLTHVSSCLASQGEAL